MATMILSTVGATLGATVGGPLGAQIGRLAGATLGGMIDQRVFGQSAPLKKIGKVEKFRLQDTAEGNVLPRIFGRSRLAGQMIWSSKFLEKETEHSGGGKGRPSVGNVKKFSYSVSIAFALGEGHVSKIGRVWADGVEIPRNKLNLVLHSGDQNQLADPVIVAIEGIANSPAFRGTAYVVLENLELGCFGNRIPQFNFEVFCSSGLGKLKQKTIRDSLRSVCLIPGSGEYSLATETVYFPGEFGKHTSANVNTSSDKSDFLEGISDLRKDLPNCKSISLVVSWFGNDLRCGQCLLHPKVEQSLVDGKTQAWKVSGLSRKFANVIAKDKNKRSVFGGTPSDASVVQAIQHLKKSYGFRKSGQDLVFYPFILMEILKNNTLPNPWKKGEMQPIKPWRGRITTSLANTVLGTPDKTVQAGKEVTSFFGAAQVSDFSIQEKIVIYSGPDEWSYRRFILHYATLCKAAGGVDAFCIGSEMRSLTEIRDGNSSFPAVKEFVKLAKDVRDILGSKTKIGYAADWSEYFGYHPNDGTGDVFFHLDALWASKDIDFIGIDNYMPLSDWRDGSNHADIKSGSIYNLDYLKGNIEGGEGYNWCYKTELQREKQLRTSISDQAHGEDWIYRYKDIRNWWLHRHHNRIAGVRSQSATDWIPQSKPIWFTEFGCSAIDKGTNQPNVFIDPKSSESAMPHFSNGKTDEFLQRQYIRAVMEYWNDTNNNPTSLIYNDKMVDITRAHLWAWDARPWPDFPARTDVWSDGGNYQTGHWISGRMYNQDLSSVVAQICLFSDLSDFDVSELYGSVIGYSIVDIQTGRESLQPLMQAYSFSCVERDGKLVFHHINDAAVRKISMSDVALDIEGEAHFTKTRTLIDSAYGHLRLKFYNPDDNYQSAEVETIIDENLVATTSYIDLPLALHVSQAKNLVRSWGGRAVRAQDQISFALPPSEIELMSGDVISFQDESKEQEYRIDEIEEQGARLVVATRIEPDYLIDFKEKQNISVTDKKAIPFPVHARIIDLPLLPERACKHAPYVFGTAYPWREIAVYSCAGEEGFKLSCLIKKSSIFGRTLTDFDSAIPNLWSPSELKVKTSSTGLQSCSEISVLNGANVFAIKDNSKSDWEVVQYQKAELQNDGTVLLSIFLRGQLGTDTFIPKKWPRGAEIIFLDTTMSELTMPLDMLGVTMNYRIGPAEYTVSHKAFKKIDYTPIGVGLRPYAPAHLSYCKFKTYIDFKWMRRTRIGGDNWHGLDVPIGESSEQYFVEVKCLGKVIRKETVTKSNWRYSKAQQSFDQVQKYFELSVCQISESYGYGSKIRINVNVEDKSI